MKATLHGLEPFDRNDKFDLACDKYRKRFAKKVLSAVRQGQNEYSALLTGSFVGIAEALIAGGADPARVEEWMKDMSEFSIAQATRGEVIPPGYATKYGVGGSA